MNINIGIYDELMRDKITKDFKKFFSKGRKKEYIGDLITIKARNLKNCCLQIIDSRPKFELVPDEEYGIIRTMFKTSYYGDYKIPIGECRDFDTLLILGLNKEKETIEKVYAIPEKELNDITSITITKTSKKYAKFKIDNKPYNQIYQYLKTGNYSILEDNFLNINKLKEEKDL